MLHNFCELALNKKFMYRASIFKAIILSLVLFSSSASVAMRNDAIIPTPSSIINASICSGDSYKFNGIDYTVSGTYSVHFISAAGGDSIATLNLIVNPLPSPSVSASGSTIFCAGDSVTLTASSGGTYLWNTGSKNQSITVLSSGYYWVYYTDNNGCNAFSPHTNVNVNPLPTISTGAIADICAGSQNLLFPFSATTGSPDQYSITWNQATITAGMTNVSWTTLGASPIIVNNPPGHSGSYGGVLRVRNSITGCESIQGTPTVTPICAIAGESGYVILTAPAGGLISEITFASYGTPKGSCGNFSINPTCHAANSDSVPKARCIGQNGCVFSAANYYFGDPCPNTFKFMYVQANTITINPPNPINFFVKRQSNSTTNASICAGSTYLFNGNTYSNTGTYYVYLTNSVGCDSVAILNLNVKAKSTTTISATICSGSSYTFNGNVYSVAGSYIAHLTNSVGCDSAATLLLTVKSASYSRTNASICAGTSYQFNGINYTTSGTYTTHLINAAGCDSAATLVLTVRDITTSTTNASICSGSSYTFNGNVYSTAGTYTVYLTNAENCDSVATLVLTVTPLPTVASIQGVNTLCKGTVTVLSESTVGGTWLSANNKVGILNGNGSVVGAAVGTDTISYAVTNACGTATSSIVISVSDLLYVAPISGVDGICLGNNASYVDTSIGGVWSISNPAIATIDASGNVSTVSAGKTTINYSITNGCGMATATKDIIVSTSKPVVQVIGGVSAACAGTTSTLTDATIGGKWSSDNDAIAIVNDSTGVVAAIADGSANITYTVGAALGCSASVSVPFTVSCSTVSTGGEGGLESKSMGDAVAKRVYNKALVNTTNIVDYSMMPIVKEGRGKMETMGVVTPGTQAVTYLMPSLNAIGTGFTGYDMSAGVADLPGITNASTIKAYDYTVNAQTKASTLISRTYGLVYQHTKPICDRLKEATLMDVKQVKVQGMNFIQYKLLQNSGQIEYAISFSAGIQQGVDSFKIQSVWLTQNFTSQDTMFNFQIWSVDAGMTVNMLKSTLNKLSNLLPLTQVNSGYGVPSTYISKITRNQNKLLLTINNNSASTNGTLNLVLNSNENSLNQTSTSIPVSFLPDATTDIAVDLNDNYESDVHLFVDGVQQDMAYMNDGNWNYSVSYAAVHPNSFNITNDGVMPVDSTEFRLLRNVHVNVNVTDYVSIYKLLKAGGVTKDLTQFANLEFNAAAVGSGQIKIVIQKSSISNWNSQYSYTLPISGNLNHYKVKLSDFVSSTSSQPLIADDVITVTFSFISVGGNNIDATITNVKFTQNKSAFVPEALDSFSAKTILAFPNPAKDKFVCTFQSDKKATLQLKIVELSSGRVVEVETITALIGNNIAPVTVNKKKIMSGTYILVLEGEGVRYQPFKMLFKD